MADFSHRPGWKFASEGTHRPPPQGSGGSRGPSGARRTAQLVPAAETEYRVGRALRDGLADGGMIFSDRRLGGTRVDHIVVVSSGVWVVDAKKRAGVRWELGASGDVVRLTSDMRPIATQLEHLGECVDLVAQLVRDPSVPVRPALAVLPQQCRLATRLRMLSGKAVNYGHVVVGAPRGLAEQMRMPGLLRPEQVVRIGHRIDEALAAR